MICPSYIHEYDVIDSTIMFFESINKNILDEYNNLYLEYEKDTYYDTEINSFSQYLVEDAANEKKVGFVTKIGQLVQKAIAKLIEIIDNFITGIASFFNGKRAKAKEVEEFLKKNPKFNDEIQVALSKGDLDIKDLESMETLIKSTNNIVAMAKNDNVEPDELQNGINKAMNAYEKYGKPLITLAGAATTVVSIGLAIKTMIPKFQQSTNEAKRIKTQTKLLKIDSELSKDPKKNAMVSRHISKVCSAISTNFNKRQGVLKKVGSLIDTFVSKHGLDEKSIDAKVKENRKKLANDKKELNNELRKQNQILGKQEKIKDPTVKI